MFLLQEKNLLQEKKVLQGKNLASRKEIDCHYIKDFLASEIISVGDQACHDSTYS